MRFPEMLSRVVIDAKTGLGTQFQDMRETMSVECQLEAVRKAQSVIALLQGYISSEIEMTPTVTKVTNGQSHFHGAISVAIQDQQAVVAAIREMESERGVFCLLEIKYPSSNPTTCIIILR